ncbi:phosphate ABC transporter ATP-binding protein PstB [Cysteiniphilum halobium]|uniref:phosphate ABC transporter ATP-binding protein PstB n=1 Tax=Cysteiniphilum halobium TaxID=2219059 RepID=UPI000E6460C5|nr:phosphate ABC transporter ATP-binding protein PstB [Cysteiniphilum halobium]
MQQSIEFKNLENKAKSQIDNTQFESHRRVLNLPNQQYLAVKNLNFYYGDSKTLHDINASFAQNKITALIGPSGSGKSTLLRTLNRIYELYPKQKATGQILLQGQNVLEKNIDLNQLRKEIGMVFQKPTPFPMSIFDNIAFAIKLHEKLAKAQVQQRVEEALKQAALWDEVKDKLQQQGTRLSGGQQQRLCIARTLAVKPKILLLDEPTSALDPISTKKIERLLTELKTQYTIVMVTHNLKQAERLSDSTMFMINGELVEYAPTDVFFNTPKDPRTVDYIHNE